MPAGRICWGNWRTAMAYRSMSLLCTAVRGGITGGMTSRFTYFGMVVGFSVPPGSWANACGRTLPPRTKNDPPATAPVFRKSRRVSMYASFAKAVGQAALPMRTTIVGLVERRPGRMTYDVRPKGPHRVWWSTLGTCCTQTGTGSWIGCSLVELLGEVVGLADTVYQGELGLQPIDVPFLIRNPLASPGIRLGGRVPGPPGRSRARRQGLHEHRP